MRACWAAALAWAAGCHAGPDGPAAPGDPVDARFLTTVQQVHHASAGLDVPMELNPTLPEGLEVALELGLGGESVEPGEPRVVREDLVAAGVPGARRSLFTALHQADAQIADAESPTRLVALDSSGFSRAAARPQELYALHLLDALVEAANRVHAATPIDFAVVAGDNADSSQRNETDWFRDTLDGAPFLPDSGDPDHQVDVDGNDPLAEFSPRGFAFPWFTVLGNHDVLVQGNFDPAIYADAAVGSAAIGGTRDLSLPGGPLTFLAVPDDRRELLDRAGLVAAYGQSGGDSHGFVPGGSAASWVAHPVPGVMLIGLDTNPPGYGGGLLRAVDRDDVLLPALEAAESAGELVVVTSHYALGSTEVEGGGSAADLLLEHPNVVLTLTGHSHVNRVAPHGSASGGFWEIQTASSVDWPCQVRVVELVDNGDGTLSIFTTQLDAVAPAGSLAARGLWLARIDHQAGWASDGSGSALDRNTELLVPLPAGVSLPVGRADIGAHTLDAG